MKAPARRYLGGVTGMALRTRVYSLPDALEVDEITVGEIRRTRVYFDDILLLTQHQDWGVAGLILAGLIFAGSCWMIWMGVNEKIPALSYIFLGVAFLFLLFILARLILRIDVITLYGRRTSAQMKFAFLKERARRIARDLERAIRAHQAKTAPARPLESPPAVPGAEPPPPPPRAPEPGAA